MGDVLVLGRGAVWLSSAIGFYWLSGHLDVKILDSQVLEQVKDSVGPVEVVVNYKNVSWATK